MNSITKERLALRLVTAQKQEDLLNKEVGVILNIPMNSVSMLRQHWDRVADKHFDSIREWVISGQTLRKYPRKSETVPDDGSPSYEEVQRQMSRQFAEDVAKIAFARSPLERGAGPFISQVLIHKKDRDILTPEIVEDIVLQVEVYVKTKQL